MSKTQHTSGPWGAETGWNDKQRIAITAKLGPTVCDNTRGLICETLHTPFLEQELANARLIAAAPELLEFVVDLLSIIRKHGSISGSEQTIAASAEALIAKATGGKS